MHDLIMLIAYSRDVPDKLSQSFTVIIGPILRLTNETLLIRTITKLSFFILNKWYARRVRCLQVKNRFHVRPNYNIIKSAPSSGKASLDPQNVTNIGNVGIECKYWLVLSIPLVLKVGMNIFKSKIYYLCYILWLNIFKFKIFSLHSL